MSCSKGLLLLAEQTMMEVAATNVDYLCAGGDATYLAPYVRSNLTLADVHPDGVVQLFDYELPNDGEDCDFDPTTGWSPLCVFLYLPIIACFLSLIAKHKTLKFHVHRVRLVRHWQETMHTVTHALLSHHTPAMTSPAVDDRRVPVRGAGCGRRAARGTGPAALLVGRRLHESADAARQRRHV